VIALHAVWSRDSRLCLWGEDSSLSARVRGRPPLRPGPRRHPFACGADALAGALERLDVALPPAASDRSSAGARELALMLPSSRLGPQASPQLLRAVEDGMSVEGPGRLDAWKVPALELPAGGELALLLALPVGPVAGVAVGESLRFLGEAGKLGLELVARGRLLPDLVRRGDRWVARWRPITDAPGDRERVAVLVRSMPALMRAELCSSGEGDASAGSPPAMIVGEVLQAVVDGCAREFLGDGLVGPRVGERADGGTVDAWLGALTGEDPVVDGDVWELAALAERLEQWRLAGERYAVQRMFRTCFRLRAPGEADEREGLEEADELGESDELWRVEILLQAKDDPSVLVAAEEVWARSGRLVALGHMLEHPQERLLGGLGYALRLWPGLEPALREATPTGVELDSEGAYGFLRDAMPALEQGGFGVLAPAWLGERMRVKLRAKPMDEEWEEGSGLFGIDGLCAYEWRVAVGEETLSLDELRALAALKVPLVRSRGRWIVLRAEDVEAALGFFKRRQERGTMSAGELLREGLALGGAGAAADGLDVEVEGEGWLGELLRADGEHRLRAIPTPASFVGELRPYQERGLAWLAFLSSLGLGACLADDMGLGKTIQLLALLLAEREAAEGQSDGPARPTATRTQRGSGKRRRGRLGPTLLICPMSVLGNWRREAQRFAPDLRVRVHHGRGRLKDRAFVSAARSCDLVLSTYALALRDRETLGKVKWERIVLDEAQNIKSGESKQTRAIRALKARHRVALTGTPVENRLSELHSIMDFLNPGLLGSAGSFRERFETPIERYRDGRATARLRQATGPFILRRLKTDGEIISDLPEKIEMRVDCHLTREQATLYQAVVDDMLKKAEHAAGIERSGIILAALMKLKQVCNHPVHLLKDRSSLEGRSGKLARLEEILSEALAEGDRALCFTQFAELGQMLRAHLQGRLGHEVLFLHGGTSRTAREEMVERFQSEDGPRVFVLSLKAGGTGLNLTAANHVIHFDRWWNPAVEDQATDRAFRIGQRKNVQVRKLTCVGTLEERIAQLIAEKRELAERTVGSGEAWITELDTARLRELVVLSGDAVGEAA
jgi:non-specific serine/threonine protein kinase